MDENAITRIRIRICVVLQHWIREQFEDLDSQVTSLVDISLPF